MVFQMAPPQPASKARMICSPQLVGGPEASQKGLGQRMPAKLVVRSAMGLSPAETSVCTTGLPACRLVGKHLSELRSDGKLKHAPQTLARCQFGRAPSPVPSALNPQCSQVNPSYARGRRLESRLAARIGR